jgi:hypothetical protein
MIRPLKQLNRPVRVPVRPFNTPVKFEVAETPQIRKEEKRTRVSDGRGPPGDAAADTLIQAATLCKLTYMVPVVLSFVLCGFSFLTGAMRVCLSAALALHTQIL